MQLEDLKIYTKSMDLGDIIWKIVIKWDDFKNTSLHLGYETMGKQLVKSVDSIAANIAEGYGRYHYLDTKKFNYYSRGSLYETKTWITKAFRRKLIDEENYNSINTELDSLAKMLNSYINSIGKTNQQPQKDTNN